MGDRLANKTALVTGGATGLGFAIAKRFREEGAQVIIADVNLDAGKQAAADIDARFEPLDVADESAWSDLFQRLDTDNVTLTTLVNNAGIVEPGGVPMEDTDIAQSKRIFDINFHGTFLGCKYAIKTMKSSGGSIINLSSIVGMVPAPICPSYAASKAAVRHLTQTVALYCANQSYAIRCNSIHPGQVQTPMHDAAVATTGKEAGLSLEEADELFRSMIPTREYQQTEDIANAALYLASDESRAVTGDRIMVDGGMLLSN